MKIIDLQLKNMPIMEGMIKLPPKLLAKARHEYLTAALSYASARCAQTGQQFHKSEYITTGGLNFGLKTFTSWVARRYTEVTLSSDFKTTQKTVSRTIGDFELEDLDPSYHGPLEKGKLGYEWSTKKMKLVLALVPYSGLKGYGGQYTKQANSVEVNIERLKSFAWDEYYEFIQTALDDEDEVAKKKADRMLDIFGDRIDNIEGVLEHELTHYMQFKIFGKIDKRQVDGTGKTSKDADPAEAESQAYFSSQMEFDPQIKGAAKTVEVNVKAIRRRKGFEHVSWQPMARIATGTTSLDDAHAKLKIPKHVNLGGELPFFHKLRKADPVRWKKAVKVFMTELDKRFSAA